MMGAARRLLLKALGSHGVRGHRFESERTIPIRAPQSDWITAVDVSTRQTRGRYRVAELPSGPYLVGLLRGRDCLITALNFGDARGCGKFLARRRVAKPVFHCSDACLMTMYRRRKKA